MGGMTDFRECTAEGCIRNRFEKGFCEVHWDEYTGRVPKDKALCAIVGCTRSHEGHFVCPGHRGKLLEITKIGIWDGD